MDHEILSELNAMGAAHWTDSECWNMASADDEFAGETVFYGVQELIRRGYKDELLRRGFIID